VPVVAERTFLQQFLSEVEPAAPFSSAAAHSHAPRLGGLGVHPGSPRKVRTVEPTHLAWSWEHQCTEV